MVKELKKKVKIKNTNNMPTGKFKPNKHFKMTSPLKNNSKKEQYVKYLKENPEAIDRPDFRKAMDAAFGGPTGYDPETRKTTTKKSVARNYKKGYYGA